LPIALMVAGVAATGFIVYKTVQVAGGGSVDVEFPGKDGKSAAQPLPAMRRVAVWPGEQDEVKFSQRLQSSGRFAAVVAPSAVSTLLAGAHTPTDLKQMTDKEKGDA